MRTLHGRLAAVLAALCCILGLISIAITMFFTQSYMHEVDQRLNRSLAQHLAEHLTAKKLLLKQPLDLADIRAESGRLMILNPNIDIYLLDPQGAILTASTDAAAIKRRRVRLAPIRLLLNGDAHLPISGDDPRSLRQSKVFSVAPISAQGRSLGYLYIILGGDEQDSVARRFHRSYILRLVSGMTIGLLVSTLAIGLLLFQHLTRRLRRLTAAMNAFQQQDYREKVPLPHVSAHPPKDEIDQLGLVYVRMSERIMRQIQMLHEADALRREAISNVSHDLRTPLAALHGYLETLLMKEDLTQEERRSYLSIAVRHCERLIKLVSELFELAKLEGTETQIHAETFAPGELVQDIVQKYRLLSEQRHLRLQARISEALPFVLADIGLIERALENLLENALRFTPDGGSVVVSVEEASGKVMVTVQDTGPGIPPEHLPHIFDRHYRAERNRPNTGGAGLGLAITKRILELHGSSISAHSAPGQGAVFTFDLPVAPTDR